MNVYVVLSDVINTASSSHGMHGVYASKSGAKTCAISAIISIAKNNGHNITMADIEVSDYDNELYLNYSSDTMDIAVSCIKQEIL